MTTLNKVEKLGFSIQSNLCVFCSRTYDRQDKICVSCREYKGMMNILDAVDYYGMDILPNQGNVRPPCYNQISTKGKL